MKIFGLIIAILIWLLTAFGCEAKPAIPADTPAPTAGPSTDNAFEEEREDTMMPEL